MTRYKYTWRKQIDLNSLSESNWINLNRNALLLTAHMYVPCPE